MLTITIAAPREEYFDEATNSFIVKEDLGTVTVDLEHSLVSLSKWESIWKKPFLAGQTRPNEEVFSYVECMCQTPNFPRGLFSRMSQANLDAVTAYIEDPMTATTFHNVQPEPKDNSIITSELLYSWLILYNVDWEVQHWHLNRLFTLIKILQLKTSDTKPKPLTRADLDARRELNRRILRENNTRG